MKHLANFKIYFSIQILWAVLVFSLFCAAGAWRADNPDKKAVIDTIIMNTLRTEIDTVIVYDTIRDTIYNIDGEYRAIVTTDEKITIEMFK